jgi:hypothetical protein
MSLTKTKSLEEFYFQGGKSYQYGGKVPVILFPDYVCPTQLNLDIIDNITDIPSGVWNRITNYTGGTFQGGYTTGDSFPDFTFVPGSFSGTGETYSVWGAVDGNDYFVLSYWYRAITGVRYYVFFRSQNDYFFNGEIILGQTGLSDEQEPVKSGGISYPYPTTYRFPARQTILTYPRVCPSPTPQPSLTPTTTPTNTSTPSITPTNTSTPNLSPSNTPTQTMTTTPTITPTKTITPTPSQSVFTFLGRTTPDAADGSTACSTYTTTRSYQSNKSLSTLTIGDFLYDTYPSSATNGNNLWVALKVGGVGQGYAFQVATDGEILDTYTC